MPKILNLTCKHCHAAFTRKVSPSTRIPVFCSVVCRNKARTKDIPTTGVCPNCGVLFKQRNKYMPSTFCSNACAGAAKVGKRKPFSIMQQEIMRSYATKGAQALAEQFGVSIDAIQTFAYRIGLRLNKKRYQQLVHEAAREYMKRNNPMQNPHSRKKMSQTLRRNPGYSEHMRKFQEGHRRLAKTKPSKPELYTCAILDRLGIAYEHQAKIGNKFFVDFRIGKTILQIDGEYWHGHPRFAPLTKRQLAQQRRDRSHDSYCRACGYTVVRIWAEQVCDATIVSALV